MSQIKTKFITDSAVTNAKLANMANNTVKANKSGISAAPSDLALSSVTETGSAVLTISNGSNSVVSASNLTIQVSQSTTSTSGYLSSTDWNTFNNKQATITIGALDAQAANANGLALVSNVLSTQSADATHPGMVNNTTQTMSGAKTFSTSLLSPIFSSNSANPASAGIFRLANAEFIEWRNAANSGNVTLRVDSSDIAQFSGAVNAGGNITGANLSGTNTGDVTLAAFGSTPNANGASLSGQVLTLQPADGTNPGGVSTGTQTLAGAKTFSTSVTSPAHISSTANPASAGVVRLANADNISWRNAANSGNISVDVDSNNNFNLLSLGTGLVLNGSTSGNFVQKAADTTTSYSVKWPSAQAAVSGYVLSNDASGNLSWVAQSGGSLALSQVTLNTAVSVGSAASNEIIVWTNADVNTGSDLTYTSDAVNGDKITVNTAGWYTIEVCLGNALAATSLDFAITVNQSSLTTSASSQTYSTGRRAYVQNGLAAAAILCATFTSKLAVNDVVRVNFESGASPKNSPRESFNMIRIA